MFIDAEVKAVKASSRLERGDGVLYQVYTPRGFGKGSAASAPSRGGSQRGSCRQHTVSAGKPSRVSTGSVLGRPVDVKLLESGLIGSDVCRFEIRL